jgi:hypothetical protein
MIGHDAANSAIGEAVGPTWGVVKWNATGYFGSIILNSDGNIISSAGSMSCISASDGSLISSQAWQCSNSSSGVAFANGLIANEINSWGFHLFDNNLTAGSITTRTRYGGSYQVGLLSDGQYLYYNSGGGKRDCALNLQTDFGGSYTDLARSVDGKVYVLNASGLQQYDSNNKPLWSFGITGTAQSVCVDLKNQAWVASSEGVVCVSSEV